MFNAYKLYTLTDQHSYATKYQNHEIFYCTKTIEPILDTRIFQHIISVTPTDNHKDIARFLNQIILCQYAQKNYVSVISEYELDLSVLAKLSELNIRNDNFYLLSSKPLVYIAKHKHLKQILDNLPSKHTCFIKYLTELLNPNYISHIPLSYKNTTKDPWSDTFSV